MSAVEPVAKQVPHTWDRPTGPADDPFAWLRDRNDPDTAAYLEAENAYADAWFGQHADTVEAIFQEIKARTQETDTAAPVRKGDWWYVTSTIEGQSYPVHRRGRTAATATDQLVLDQNAEAAGKEFFDLGAFEISNDQRFVAWSADLDGHEHYTMRVREIETGLDLVDELHDTTWAGTAWSRDGDYLFYVVADEFERPYRVMRHRLGTPQSDDVEVYVNLDERVYVYMGATRNEQAIVISAHDKLSSEVYLLDPADPTAAPRLVHARRPNVEYHVDHWGDRLVIMTNLPTDVDGELVPADDFRVMTAPLDAPAEWSDFVPHTPGRRITGVDPFAGHLAVLEWADAQPQVRIVQRDGSSSVLAIDAEPHDVGIGANETWDTQTLRLHHASLTVPARTIDVDVVTGAIEVVKETPVLGVDLADYTSERLWATASDGTKVPVDIVRHTDTALDGTAPIVVYAYGSYEASMPPWFSIARLSLLDRGYVWALAHPRGGGELGRQWYLDGKLLNKRNTFTDVIACADHLAASGVGDGDRIAIRGGSAGGLMVGACVTIDRSRFSVGVAEVPFVDVVTTMSDPTLPLTATEWDEWGDPREEPYASYMLTYSPYDNTVPGDYPALFVTAGLNDPRVSYHEPAKWTARLRQVRTNDRPLLLRTEMGAGHAGPSGRYDAWRDEARTLTFILANL